MDHKHYQKVSSDTHRLALSYLHDADILLTRAEAAEYLRRSVPTLERWAAQGEGPVFRKVGGRVLYPLKLLRRYVGSE